MPNTLTDQYQLVTQSTLDASFIQVLLGKTVNYNDGFCRELFRDGRHLKSLRSPNDTFSARKGDTMLSVNMGIITVPFTDKLPTRDGYHISYDASVRLAVWDPKTFAVCYVQSIDPVQKTLDVIRAALLRDVAQGRHDDMSDVYMRKIVEYNTGARRPTDTAWGWREITPVDEYGIAILEAQTMIPHADPKRVEEREEAKRVRLETERLERERAIELERLKHQEVVDSERKRVEDQLAKQQREIDVRKQSEAHADDMAQWEHDRFKLEQGTRRDAALSMEIEHARQQEAADREQLAHLRSRGIPTADILQEYPELAYLLQRRNLLTGEVINGPDLQRLASPAAPQATHARNAQDGSGTLYGITSEPRTDDIITISHFGIKVSRHVLNDKEAEWAQAAAQSLAYFVEAIEPSGIQNPSQELQREDLIYQIDDKPVPELAELAPYLDMQQRQGVPVKVTYLRGMYSDVTVIDIPVTR